MGPSSFAAVTSLEFLIGLFHDHLGDARRGVRTHAGAATMAVENAPPSHEVMRDAPTTHIPAG